MLWISLLSLAFLPLFAAMKLFVASPAIAGVPLSIGIIHDVEDDPLRFTLFYYRKQFENIRNPFVVLAMYQVKDFREDIFIEVEASVPDLTIQNYHRAVTKRVGAGHNGTEEGLREDRLAETGLIKLLEASEYFTTSTTVEATSSISSSRSAESLSQSASKTQLDSTTVAVSTSKSTSTSSEPASPGLSIGAKIGIVVGLVAGLMQAIFVVLFIRRRKRLLSQKKEEAPVLDSPGPLPPSDWAGSSEMGIRRDGESLLSGTGSTQVLTWQKPLRLVDQHPELDPLPSYSPRYIPSLADT